MTQTFSVAERCRAIHEAAERAAQRVSELCPYTLEAGAWAVGDGGPEQLVGILARQDRVVGAVFHCAQPAGYLLLGFSPDSAGALVRATDEKTPPDGETDEGRLASVLTEFGNIFAGSFVSSLAEHSGLEVRMGAPGYVDDMSGAVIDGLLSAVGEENPVLTRIELTLHCREHELEGHLTFVGPPLLWESVGP